MKKLLVTLSILALVSTASAAWLSNFGWYLYSGVAYYYASATYYNGTWHSVSSATSPAATVSIPSTWNYPGANPILYAYDTGTSNEIWSFADHQYWDF